MFIKHRSPKLAIKAHVVNLHFERNYFTDVRRGKEAKPEKLCTFIQIKRNCKLSLFVGGERWKWFDEKANVEFISGPRHYTCRAQLGASFSSRNFQYWPSA